MSTLQALLDILMQNGLIALIAMAVILGELAYLFFTQTTTPRYSAFLANGMAGFFILVALYVSMTDGPGLYIALALIAALIAHSRDVFVRRRALSPPKS